MQTTVVSDYSLTTFNNRINDLLMDLINQEYVIYDIRYIVNGTGGMNTEHCAMILWGSKEYSKYYKG